MYPLSNQSEQRTGDCQVRGAVERNRPTAYVSSWSIPAMMPSISGLKTGKETQRKVQNSQEKDVKRDQGRRVVLFLLFFFLFLLMGREGGLAASMTTSSRTSTTSLSRWAGVRGQTSSSACISSVTAFRRAVHAAPSCVRVLRAQTARRPVFVYRPGLAV